MKGCGCSRALSSPIVTQVAISIATGVLVSFAFEWWRSRQARAPLPQGPAPGVDHV